MADTTNLSQFLSDVANAIKNKKGTTVKIPAANFDTEILSIETGIDTSDATATANDIVSGKTAYVNGQKITGAVVEDVNTSMAYELSAFNDIPSMEMLSVSSVDLPFDRLVRAGCNYSMNIPYETAVNTIGLTADKILKGNTILGIEGTAESSENLQEQLDAQDTIIEELQKSLDNKASSTDIKPNIFMQETEPVKKEGIWLKGNYQVDNIVADENIFVSEEWNTIKMSSLKVIPYNFYYGSAVSIGTDIYLFGGSGGNNTAYKYDTLTDTYTQLTNIPYDFRYGSAVAIRTNVYLFGGSGGTTKVYKYDTLTDTYTQLTNIPYEFYYGSVVAIGTDIYLFGGPGGLNTAYKYNTSTDTYTQLTNISYEFYNGSVVAIGTDIYLFGGNGYRYAAYKYNTLTDTYTSLTNIPYDFRYGSAVAIGTNVYLFGSENSRTTAYKYNTLTDTYTQLTNIPYNFYNGSAVFTGTDIYLFGGENYLTKVQIMVMIPNDYGNNSIVISQGGCTKNTNIANYGIQNAKFYYDRVYYQDENGNLLSTIPTYNGNGKEWIKISGGEG